MGYLWLDLETTGLDNTAPEQEILEVAWLITDTNLDDNRTPIKSAVVTPNEGTWAKIAANPFVATMHADSGLMDALHDTDTESLGHVEALILDAIDMAEMQLDGEAEWWLAGQGVYFDRTFIQFHMPALYARLSYKVFDVRTLQQFFGSSIGIPESLANLNPHRAASDIAESLEYARWYAGQLRAFEEIATTVSMIHEATCRFQFIQTENS